MVWNIDSCHVCVAATGGHIVGKDLAIMKSEVFTYLGAQKMVLATLTKNFAQWVYSLIPSLRECVEKY
jgi:hypothetical protein